MSWRPKITTAIPARRYIYGEFTAILLTEIDTEEDKTYHHILAIVKDGAVSPEAYIVNQTGPQHSHDILVLSADRQYHIMSNEQALDIDTFCKLALQGMAQMYELTDESPKLI